MQIVDIVLQDGQCVYKHNIKVRLQKHCCCGTAISIQYAVYVFVALVMQHACAQLYCHVACSAVQNFFHVS